MLCASQRVTLQRHLMFYLTNGDANYCFTEFMYFPTVMLEY